MQSQPGICLRRNAYHGLKAAHRTVCERDVATVAAGDIAGDGKAEAGAAFVLIARFVQSEERLEHVLAQFFGGMPGPSSSMTMVSQPVRTVAWTLMLCGMPAGIGGQGS